MGGLQAQRSPPASYQRLSLSEPKLPPSGGSRGQIRDSAYPAICADHEERICAVMRDLDICPGAADPGLM